MTQFRKYEQTCLLLSDAAKDLRQDPSTRKYVTWNATAGHDAIGIQPSGKITTISKDRFALHFEKNLYRIDNIIISPDKPKAYACIWVTFQIFEGLDDQFIVSNCNGNSPTAFRGISASSEEIHIWGAENDSSVSIKCTTTKRWITVFVSWSNDGAGTYSINDDEIRGTFKCAAATPFMQTELFIGGKEATVQASHRLITNQLNGAIASLEIYTQSSHIKESMIPLELQSLVTKAKLIKDDDDDDGSPAHKTLKCM